MLSKKNIKAGKINKILFLYLLFSLLFIFQKVTSSENLNGNNTNIKVLDKISSKNTLVKLNLIKLNKNETILWIPH